MKRDRPEAPLEYIDTTADVQKEASDIAVTAGVSDLRVMFFDGNSNVPVELTVMTSTGAHRGVHMSRLVRAAETPAGTQIEGWLRRICLEVNRTQPGAVVTCRFELPFDGQFAKVAIRTTQHGLATYSHTVTGMTACPCSKKMVGIGHMQRAELTMITKGRRNQNSLDLVSRMTECFSARPRKHLKRLEEAKKILEAQANPKFAEDVVRECLKRFPDAVEVTSRCFESIHFHQASASWTSKGSRSPAF